MKTYPERVYKPAQSYQDVLWLRRNYAPARIYWERVREKVKQREHGLCQRCKQQAGTECHHQVYMNVLFSEHLWVDSPDVLQWLCHDCHQIITEERKKNKVKRKFWKW